MILCRLPLPSPASMATFVLNCLLELLLRCCEYLAASAPLFWSWILFYIFCWTVPSLLFCFSIVIVAIFCCNVPLCWSSVVGEGFEKKSEALAALYWHALLTCYSCLPDQSQLNCGFFRLGCLLTASDDQQLQYTFLGFSLYDTEVSCVFYMSRHTQLVLVAVFYFVIVFHWSCYEPLISLWSDHRWCFAGLCHACKIQRFSHHAGGHFRGNQTSLAFSTFGSLEHGSDPVYPPFTCWH